MMNTIFKVAVLALTAILMYFADISPQPAKVLPGLGFVGEAQAIAGVRRRSARRGVAVGYSAGAAAASSTAAAATAAPPPPPPAQPAAAPAAPPPVYGSLPQGTVISVLPAGCVAVNSAGTEYQHCGENYFRTAFQGNNLVYVVATPGQ